MTDQRPPRDNLVRAIFPGVEYRESGTGAGTMTGHFAVFDSWTRISSSLEGTFMERIAPGAFKKAFSETRPKVLFQHGKDPDLGDKVIGSIRSLQEDDRGAAYEVELFDGLPPLVMSGLRAKPSAYGASFRFSVVKEDWKQTPARSATNPDGLPERTILEARVPEFGPVTFPAYGDATAAVRSMTDEFVIERLSRDPERLMSIVEALPPEPDPSTPTRVEPPPDGPSIEPHDPPEGGSSDSRSIDVDYISREDKVARVKELEAILKRTSEDYTGVLPADVQSTFDADKAERAALIEDIRASDERREFVRSIEDPGKTERTYEAPTVIRTKPIEDIYEIRGGDTPGTLRDKAMRSLDSSFLPASANTDALVRFVEREQDAEDESGRVHQEATRRILLTGSPAYRRAFAKYLKNGNRDGWTPEESRAAALAVTGTTTTGGYAVPYVFDPTFIHIGAHTSINPYRAACRVETISGGNNWRAVTATAITAKWDAEAAASVEGGPTIGQPTFTVQRADAFATVSIETLQDRPDVTEELSSLFAEAKDTLEENSFTLGVGTTVYPQGMFLSGAFTVQSTATNDTTAIADTLLVEAALPLRHRLQAAWFMSRSTQRQLEALDTTGYYFKRPGQNFAMGSNQPANSPVGNTGTTLLGYPIWEVPSAVSTLTTDAAVIAVFGDPRNYVIVDRIGMNVEVVPLMLNGATPSFPTGQRGIYCYWRATARALNVDGMRQLDVN